MWASSNYQDLVFTNLRYLSELLACSKCFRIKQAEQTNVIQMTYMGCL